MKFFAQFLSIVFVTVWLYVPLTKYSFFQDDFILFDMANRIKSLQDAFARSETIFWRPVALGYFWVGQRVFGLDPYKFHLVSLGTHIINALLVWLLVSRLTKGSDPKDRKDRILPGDIGWLAGLLFGTSAIHFMSQVWVGEYPIILGLTFWLLTLLVGWAWAQRPTWIKALTVIAFYSLGLLTHELTLLTPLVIMGFVVFLQGFGKVGSFLRSHMFQFLTLLIPGLLYLTMRLIVSSVQISGTYAPIGISDAAKSLWWYLLWMFNIPEELKYQSFVPFSIRPEFAVNFPLLSTVWRAQLIAIPLLGFIVPLVLTRRSEKKSIINTATISLVLSIGGGAILSIALGHQYPFLSSFALVGVVTLFSGLLGSLTSRGALGTILVSVFLSIWILSSWSSLRFSEKSHWTVQEAEMAKRIVQAAKDQFGFFPPGSTVIIPLGIDGKHKAAMADQLGIRIMFKEQDLTTYFGTLQGVLPPECTETSDLGACLLEHHIYRIKV